MAVCADNKNILAPHGLTMINCSNTGEYLPFNQHCCTNLDIEICKFSFCVMNSAVAISSSIPACTKGNGQVAGSQCMGSMVTPSPSVSTHMPSTESPSLRSEATIWIYVGIAIVVAMIILATVSVIFLVKKCRKSRNQELPAENFPEPYNGRYSYSVALIPIIIMLLYAAL